MGAAFGIHALPLFVMAGLLPNIMPGPDSLLIMTRSAAALGIGTGTFVHIVAAFQGFLTHVLNPKVALFFLAFVQRIIDADAPHKPLAFIVPGCVFNFNGMVWCNALALFTAQASARIKRNPTLTQWLNRASGGLFVWLGVKLALAKPT